MDCQHFDPMRFAAGELVTLPEREHLTECGACTEEVAELTAMLCQVPLGDDLVAAFTVGVRDITVPHNRVPRLLGRMSQDVLPLLTDEVGKGRDFARFVELEPTTGTGAFAGARLQVTGPKGQLIPIGMPVKVRYDLDEDAEVLVVHRNGKRGVQFLFPTPPATDTFWRAGGGSFTGTIEGHHGERQQFVILATKTRVLPAQLPFADAAGLETIYHQALETARAAPQDQWCEAILPYTAIDMQVVEHYRNLADLAAIGLACLKEIHDRDDWAKAACGEVCYRVLASREDNIHHNVSELRELFIAITEKLLRYWVGHWRGTWEEQVLQDAVQEIYAQFFQTAKRRSLVFMNTQELVDGRTLQLPCYTALLAFLKTIALRVAFAESREQRRAEIQTFLRLMHRKAERLSAEEKARFQTWVFAHVLETEVERAIFDGVLAGTKPKAMAATYPVIQGVFGQEYKRLANARDAVLRRVYVEIRQQQPPDLLTLFQRLATREKDGPDDEKG